MADEYISAIMHMTDGALAAAFTLATAAVGVVTCIRGRRHSDPARVGTSWLKLTFLLSFFGYILTVPRSVAFGMAMLYNSYLIRMGDEFDIASQAFFSLAETALVITCLEIGIGFIYALERQYTWSQKIIRIIGFISVALLFILIVTCGGLYGSWLGGQPSDDFGTESMFHYMWVNPLLHANGLAIAIASFILVLDVFIMVQAAMVRHEYRIVEASRQTVNLYLVATVLALVHQLWRVARVCLLFFTPLGIPSQAKLMTPPNIILSTVIWFIILTLLFCVAGRRHNGLWTTLQPWMNGIEPTLVSRQRVAEYDQQQEKEMAYSPDPMYSPPGNYTYQTQPQELVAILGPCELESCSAPTEVPAEGPAQMLPNTLPSHSSRHSKHEMKG